MLNLFLFRSESSLDPLVQALEVLITSELNMNQAAPGACGMSSLFSMAVSDTMLFIKKKLRVCSGLIVNLAGT